MFLNKSKKKRHTKSKLSRRVSKLTRKLTNRHKIIECQFDKDNKCQSKGSGGHQGTILSVNNSYCAKVVSSDNKITDKLEYKFLNDKINQKIFKGFIPKFMGLCNSGGKKYLVIENLKYGLEKPIVIDIKVGYQTFNKNILIMAGKGTKVKAVKQAIIDKNSQSNAMGFRAEGLEGSSKRFSKSELKKMKPENFLRKFLWKDYDNKALESILKQLIKFRNIIMSPKYDNYLMAGSSMLILYDGNNPSSARVKIIDFANSFRYSSLTDPIDKKFNKQYRSAIGNLVYQFNKHLLKKQYLDKSKSKKHSKSKSSSK